MDSPATVKTGAAARNAGPAATVTGAAKVWLKAASVWLKATGAVLGFFLEAAMLAAFVYWSLQQPSPWDLVFALGIPTVTVVLWGVFLSPRSERRLAPGPVRWIALPLFLLAAAALATAGAVPLAVLMAGLAVVNFVLGWLLER